MVKREFPLFVISIHAPRVGSDISDCPEYEEDRNFNPRSPCGERRLPPPRRTTRLHFNPRSPCGERLNPSWARCPVIRHFNPRSPCGERRGNRNE